MKHTMVKPCRNCGHVPNFVASDDAEYPVLLQHEISTCPARFWWQIYALEKAAAVERWNREQEHAHG